MFKSIILYAKVARIQALAMSVMPCMLAYFLTCPRLISIVEFLLVCTSIILFHLAANTISEYRDCVKGVDNPLSPGTKYRLITGIVPAKKVLYIGIISFLIASGCGVLVCVTYPILLIPGLIGAGSALFYSEFLGLKYRGLGEIVVFLGYGPLLGFSTVYAATGACSVANVLIFIPGSLFIVCVLLANNIRDFEFDKGHTVTLTTIVGKKNSYIILYMLSILGYIMYILLAHCGLLPYTIYWELVSFPLLLLSIKHKEHPKFINFFGITFFVTEIIATLSLIFK